MTKTKIYLYRLENGGAVAVRSKIVDTAIEYALEADAGKLLTNGIVTAKCVQVTSEEVDDYYEIVDESHIEDDTQDITTEEVIENA